MRLWSAARVLAWVVAGHLFCVVSGTSTTALVVIAIGCALALMELGLELGPEVRAWARRRAECADEWLVALDGEDLALLSGGTREDMFWSRYRLTPLHSHYRARLMDAHLWTTGRFSFRHRFSGREVSTFLAGYQDRPLETDEGLTVSLRWFS